MKRIGIYKKDDVLPYVVFKGKSEIKKIRKETDDYIYGEKDYDDISVKMYSQRYQLFATQGVKCVKCGVEGEYFALESSDIKSNRYHFNLYGHNSDGKEILITKDHKTPKAKGGADNLSNYQVMCTDCNAKKGIKSDEEIEKKEQFKKYHNKKGIEWRMKEYESPYNLVLPKRIPMVIRVDGRVFRQFLETAKKPIDERVKISMDNVAVKLVENVEGAVLAYVQSDEVSVLVINYKTLDYEPWFNNELQKLVSISASIATLAFNDKWKEVNLITKKSAMFDSRVFLLPKEEVCNYFIFRQKDWSRNSVQMVARSEFDHSKLFGKSGSEMQEMLFKEKGINWNDLPTWQKRGRVVYKEQYDKEGVTRTRIKVDDEIPIFTQDRQFIEKYVFMEELPNKFDVVEKVDGHQDREGIFDKILKSKEIKK